VVQAQAKRVRAPGQEPEPGVGPGPEQGSVSAGLGAGAVEDLVLAPFLTYFQLRMQEPQHWTPFVPLSSSKLESHRGGRVSLLRRSNASAPGVWSQPCRGGGRGMSACLGTLPNMLTGQERVIVPPCGVLLGAWPAGSPAWQTPVWQGERRQAAEECGALAPVPYHLQRQLSHPRGASSSAHPHSGKTALKLLLTCCPPSRPPCTSHEAAACSSLPVRHEPLPPSGPSSSRALQGHRAGAAHGGRDDSDPNSGPGGPPPRRGDPAVRTCALSHSRQPRLRPCRPQQQHGAVTRHWDPWGLWSEAEGDLSAEEAQAVAHAKAWGGPAGLPRHSAGRGGRGHRGGI